MNRTRTQYFLFCALVVAAAPVFSFAQDIADEERSLYDKYRLQFDQLSDAGLNGGLKESNQKMLKLVEENPTPAMCLLVGNMLYSIDSEASYKLHKRAYESAPNQTTVLEWAMERHRKGEYAEAADLYQSYLKMVPEDSSKQSLLADCLIRTGKFPEAVQAWEAADHPHYHTEIDFSIFAIYGGFSPGRRRDDLLQAIHNGDDKLLEKLIYLDAHFDQDWWNKEINQPALKSDLDLARKILGSENQRFKEILTYSDLETTPETLRGTLANAGLLIGDKGRLPDSSLIAQDLVERILGAGIETKSQLLQRHESNLMQRVKSGDGDADALNLLCFLYVDQNPAKLAELDRYGWEHFGDARCAGSYLAGIASKGQLKPDSPELQKALKQFPEDSVIRGLEIRAIGNERLTADVIVSAIKAEYRKLSVGLLIPDSYTLKGLFELLRTHISNAKSVRP